MNSTRVGRSGIGVAIAMGMALGLTAECHADSWTCVQNGLIREVTIYYPNEPARLPCEVFYSKRHENALPRPLWTATNEEGYCERKAETFIDKLQSLGWQCSGDETPATVPDPSGRP